MKWLLVLMIVSGGKVSSVSQVGPFEDEGACVGAIREIVATVESHTHQSEFLTVCTAARSAPETGEEGQGG